MALKESEAIVLRTYPLREADLLVTLFTRAEGKIKGVARAGKKSRRRFGGASEAAARGRPGAGDPGAGALRRSRGQGTRAAGFVRHSVVADDGGVGLSAGGRAGA